MDIFSLFLFWLMNYLLKAAVDYTFCMQHKAQSAKSHFLTLFLTHSCPSPASESLAPSSPHILVCVSFTLVLF